MWLSVCRSDALPLGEAIAVKHDGKAIGVYHTENGLFAMENICPHMHAELHLGEVKNSIVTCALHGWPFNVESGRCIFHKNYNLLVYPIKSEAGYIWVDPDAPNRLA